MVWTAHSTFAKTDQDIAVVTFATPSHFLMAKKMILTALEKGRVKVGYIFSPEDIPEWNQSHPHYWSKNRIAFWAWHPLILKKAYETIDCPYIIYCDADTRFAKPLRDLIQAWNEMIFLPNPQVCIISFLNGEWSFKDRTIGAFTSLACFQTISRDQSLLPLPQ